MTSSSSVCILKCIISFRHIDLIISRIILQEKIDKEKDEKEKESPIEDKRFEPAGYDQDLVDMLGE